MSMVLILKSIPIVVMKVGENVSFAYRSNKHVLPTPAQKREERSQYQHCVRSISECESSGAQGRAARSCAARGAMNGWMSPLLSASEAKLRSSVTRGWDRTERELRALSCNMYGLRTGVAVVGRIRPLLIVREHGLCLPCGRLPHTKLTGITDRKQLDLIVKSLFSCHSGKSTGSGRLLAAEGRAQK